MAKAKQVYSWGDIPQATFEAFYKAVVKLRKEMIPRDCDGDHPIDILIVNRMEQEPINYVAVPRDEVYSYVTHEYLEVHPDRQQEMTDETERALTANVHMAAEVLGLIENSGSNLHRVYSLTALGSRIAGQLRQHKAKGRSFHSFVPKV